MRIVTRTPTGPLAPFVAQIGLMEGDFAGGRELALPSGTTQLLVNLDADTLHVEDGGRVRRVGGAAVQGASSRPVTIDPAEQRAVIWVAFRLGGAYPFFAPPAGELRDDLVDLRDLWGADGATLRERLLAEPDPARRLAVLEDLLLRRQVRPPVPDRGLVRAAQALHVGATVAAAGDLLGWSTRRLGRALVDQIGLTPKRFARVRRFQRLLRRATATTEPDWARLAVECGYYDQPHLVNDFRALSGLTPGAYTPRSPSERNHVPV